jgi:hypothetical protein
LPWTYWSPTREAPSFRWACLTLLGHFVGIGLIFAGLLLVAWLGSVFLHFLDRIERFPEEILHAYMKFEVWVFYADSVVSVFLMLVGITTFCRDVMKLLSRR